MYIRKAEYFQKKYKEENCVSGIITATVNDLIVGTPCIAHIKPFIASDRPKSIWQGNFNTSKYSQDRPMIRAHDDSLPSPKDSREGVSDPRDSGEVVSDPRPSRISYNPGGKPYKKPPEKKDKKRNDPNRTKAIDLYKMKVDKANHIIRCSLRNVRVLFLHPVNSNIEDYCECDIGAKSFCFNGIKPIIYDDCLRIEAEKLSDVYSKRDMKSFYDVAKDLLSNHRYVNYVLSPVVSSNATDIYGDIMSILNALSSACANKVSSFQYASDTCRALVDAVSISLYRLSDSIAVFDLGRSKGMCVEVLMLSKSTKNITYPGRTMTWRFLFSEHDDNIFVIDGERIQRPSDMDIKDASQYIHRRLHDNVANDAILKEKAKTVNK